MSVELQDVLALLPELFPGVQPISLDRIRPYPDNPGPPVTEDQVQELTVPILEDGLVNPLKLRPDPAGPLVPGLSPHRDNPRLKIDGTPWVVEDFKWMILSGERRWRAFHKLHGEGWVWRGGASVGHQPSYRLAQLEGVGEAFIPAHILNPTGEEAVIITHTDNDVRDRGWFAAYQSIEALIKANPALSQAQVAARLKMDSAKVNKAIGLLPCLNPEARALILENSKNSNKGKKGIFESAALVLTDLGPDISFKRGVRKKGDESQRLWPYPAIPSETQNLVRRVLAAAIDHRMTEDKVKTLVQWVKEGNKPEEFGKLGIRSEELGVKAPKIKRPGEEAYSGTEVASSSTPAYSAGTPRNDSGNYDVVKEPDLHSQVGTAIAGHELGKRLHIPTQLMNQHLPRLTRLFHRARGLFTGLGIKNPTLATFLTLLLFLFTGSAFINLTSRLVNGLCNMIFYPRLSQVNSVHLSPDPQAGDKLWLRRIEVPTVTEAHKGVRRTCPPTLKPGDKFWLRRAEW
jgi:ParB-like chromosome segregation protein Spo0J